MEKQESVLKVL